MIKKIAIRILFVFASIIISLVLVEGVLRLVIPEPENLAKLKSSSLFIQENKPNAHFTYSFGPIKDTERKMDIAYNSSGFRDVEFKKEKEKDVFRIAVLGDSQTEALQVALPDAWFKILERQLIEKLSRKVETYSFGVSGYGTGQEWLTLREKVLQFSPDLVILAFNPNDVGDTYRNRVVKLMDSKPVTIGAKERYGGNFFGKIARGTYLYHELILASIKNDFTKRIASKIRVKVLGFPKNDSTLLSDAQLGQGPFEIVASQKNPPAEVSEGWELVKALLIDMKRMSDERGVGFLITPVVPKYEVDETKWSELENQWHLSNLGASKGAILDHLAGICQSASIACYDMREDARKWQDTNGTLYFDFDAHYNENGNKFMGQSIANFILDKGIIK